MNKEIIEYEEELKKEIRRLEEECPTLILSEVFKDIDGCYINLCEKRDRLFGYQKAKEHFNKKFDDFVKELKKKIDLKTKDKFNTIDYTTSRRREFNNNLNLIKKDLDKLSIEFKKQLEVKK